MTSKSAGPTGPSPGDAEWHKLLFEQAHDGIFHADREGRYIAVNASGHKLLGYEPPELVGKSIRDIVPRDDLALAMKHLEGLRSGGRFVREWTLVRKDGSTVDAELAAQPLSDGSIVAVVRDLTARKGAGAAIEEAQARLRSLLNALPEPALLIDADLRVIAGNERLGESLGRPLDQVLGQTVAEMIPDPEVAAARVKAIRSVLESRLPLRFTDTRDSRTFQNFIEPIAEADGTVRSVAVFGRDISDLRAAAEAKRQSEARLEATVTNTPDVAIQWYDANGRVRLWNAASERMFGFSAEEALGKTLDQMIHTPEETAAFVEILQTIGKTGKPAGPNDYHFKRRDGSWGICTSTIFMIGGDDASPFFVCMDVDITRRIESEAALRRSEERLAAALRAADLTTWDWVAESPEELSSGVWQAWIDETSTRSRFDLAAWNAKIHPEDRNTAAEAFRSHLEGKTPRLDCIYRLRRSDGSIRWVHQVGCALDRDASGRALRATGVFSDITDRRRTEDEARQAQRLESIGRLAGGISHDFNNILTAIAGFAELGSADSSKTFVAESFREILAGARRAAELTQKLLAFSGRKVVQPVVVEVDAVISRLEPMLRRLMERSVTMEVLRGAAGGRVRIDVAGLEQVIVNLVVNARDAVDVGGRIKIATKMTAAPDAAGDSVVIEVTDDGRGIEQDDLKRIFEPFFTTKADGKGTGLGLPTCHGIVEQAGGVIRVESRLGVGTSFRVLLPAAGGVDTRRPQPAKTSEEAHGKESILVVDDDVAIRSLLHTYLSGLGYSVMAAPDAATALLLARSSEHRVDLLMTDLTMPGVDGLDLVRRFRVHHPKSKVICMTGSSTDRAQGAYDDLDSLVVKPFVLKELSGVVRAVLDSEPSRTPPGLESAP